VENILKELRQQAKIKLLQSEVHVLGSLQFIVTTKKMASLYTTLLFYFLDMQSFVFYGTDNSLLSLKLIKMIFLYNC